MFVLAFIAPGWLFGAISFMTIILITFNLHLIRLYNYPFKVVYYLVIENAIKNLNLTEYFGYLSLFSITEYLLFFTGISVFILFTFTKRINKNIISNLLCIIFVFLIIKRGYTRHFVQIFNYYEILDTRDQEVKKSKDTLKNFTWNAIGNELTMPKNVILIIGESHRYDYFTKYWNQKPKFDNLLYFNNMISQDYYTVPTVSNILSRKVFSENRTMKYFNELSLFKVFEEVGYETHVVRYEPLNNLVDSGMDFIFYDVQNYHLYDSSHKFEFDGFVDDRDITKFINNILSSNNNRKFIVAEMIGLHIPFKRRYPAEYNILKPSLTSVNKKILIDIKNKLQIMNSYENGINFSVDVIYDYFKIAENEKDSTLIIFISDHGTELYENGSFGYTANSKYNYHVPFMIYGNDKFMQNVDINKWNNLKNHINSTLIESDIFETIVSLSSIKYDNTDKLRKRNKDLTKITDKFIDKRPVNTINKIVIYEDI